MEDRERLEVAVAGLMGAMDAIRRAAGQLESMSGALVGVAGEIWELLDRLTKPEPEVPWTRDISGELARNAGPYADGTLQREGGWWRRKLEQIDGLTFHHTLSGSPHATARYYVAKEGGRPSIPYTIWVTETGEVLLCVPLDEGLWHDHTGHRNTHLSVGLAGSLHVNRPSEAQLEAAARVAAWAIKSAMLSGITGIGQIKGHQDYAQTVCPGWGAAASGKWKGALYGRIEGLVAG